MARRKRRKRRRVRRRARGRAHRRSVWKGCGRLCHKRLYQMPRRQIQRVLHYAHDKLSFHQRLRLFGEMFLGGRYKYGPLGEGKRGRYDRDPTFRLDKVDCVTFIETVMAFSLERNMRKAIARMQKIRYKDGRIRYSHRNHFTAAQWIIENEKAGYLKRITRRVAGRWARPYVQKITAHTWKGTRWKYRLPAHLRPRTHTVWYVPLRDIHRVTAKLPAIAWMGEVFDAPASPSVIRHVGFFLKHGKVPYFRHANIGKRGVREEPLRSYTRWRRRYYTAAKTSDYHILGYTFASLHDPTRRMQRKNKVDKQGGKR